MRHNYILNKSILGNLKVGDRNLYRITDIIIGIGAYKRDFDDYKEKIQEWTRELAYREFTDERHKLRDVDMTPISGLFDDIVPVLIQCRLPSISGISKKLQCCGQIFQKYRKSYNVG